MPDCRTIDPLVTPYVDGELPPADRRRVDDHLATCPPCHSRVAAERAVRDTMGARRRDLHGACAPPSLRTACARLCSQQSAVSSQQAAVGRRQSTGDRSQPTAALRTPHAARRTGWTTRLVPYALAASLVLLVAGAFVYQLTVHSSTVMAAELTADHLKCFAANAVLGTHDAPTAVESAMLAGFGWRVHLPDNPGQVGLELVGSRPCLYGEGEIAHVMYRHDGKPVSLFMLPKSARPEQLVEVLGHQAKIWCVGNRTFVLIAREPRADVQRLAAFVQSSLH